MTARSLAAPRRALLVTAVALVKLDDGVYLARSGRWRVVSWDGGWLVTDGAGRWNRGRSAPARTLYAARLMIGAAENTPEGRRPW